MNALRRMRPLLGTFVEIGVLPSPNVDAEQAIGNGFAVIAAIHERLSFQAPDSELSRLNRARGQSVVLSRDSIAVLRLAKAMTAASDGYFNCTLGGALIKQGALPDHGFGALQDYADAQAIAIRGLTVRLSAPVALTLDGIAKGYAVDRAITALRRAGVGSGWINAGGDLRAFGECSLPITLRDGEGRSFDAGLLQNAALASSEGRHDPRQPSLLLNKRGEALPAQLISVLAHHAWRADALTKVAACAPLAQRDGLLARLGGRLLVPV